MPYGEKLAERLQATSASVIMTRVLRKAVIAATEIQSDHPNRKRRPACCCNPANPDAPTGPTTEIAM